MRILLTGGAGYLGSHTYAVLSAAGHDPVVLDDLSNSSAEVIDRLAQATGRAVPFERGSVCDRRFVAAALARHGIEAVMHFAAFKSSRASFAARLEYYHNNVGGLTALLEAMDEAGCRRLSAAVYVDPRPTMSASRR